MPTLKELFIVTRPWSFIMTFMSITIGSLLAFLDYGVFNVWLYMIVLAASISIHAFTNVINDYYDYKHRVDFEGAPTTIYRPHPIIANILSPRATLIYALFYLLIASILGIYLVLTVDANVLTFALLGLVLAYFYTGIPFKFKYRALGEVGIFFAFGPLMVVGAYYVQTVEVGSSAVFASIPMGILIALVGFANNMKDINFDKSVNIKTLAIMLGQEKSVSFFVVLSIISVLMPIFYVVFGFLPIFTLLSAIALPKALSIAKLFKKKVPENADPLASQIVTLFGLGFITGLLITIALEMFGLNFAFTLI